MKLFNGMAQLLFDGMNRWGIKVLQSAQVKSDLERLHPGVDKEDVYRKYYVNKLEKTLLIFVGGTALAILLTARAEAGRKPDAENRIARGGVADETRNVTVETVLDGKKESFQIPVRARELLKEDAEGLYQEFRQRLPQMIAGDNPSLQEVRYNLVLEDRYEDYPFSVEWQSGDTESITSGGTVKEGELAKEVWLTARSSYGELEWEEQLQVIVPAIETAQEEKTHGEIEELLLASEQGTRLEEYWVLPENWNGETLEWTLGTENNSLLVWVGTLIAGGAVYFMKDKDLHDELQKRRLRMKREYPDIVHKLTLYLGAGMTIRGAFQKIADEYGQRRKAGHPEEPAYEEMLTACRELNSGVSEGAVYEHFGKRTGLQEYIRLVTLMTQNLKKGNHTLLQRLREEADRACLERIQNSRRLGEEASTKLLVPMVMMLGVVMVMVMLPALGSMGM